MQSVPELGAFAGSCRQCWQLYVMGPRGVRPVSLVPFQLEALQSILPAVRRGTCFDKVTEFWKKIGSHVFGNHCTHIAPCVWERVHGIEAGSASSCKKV